MTTPKPYGLTKEQDLRWECLQLAALTSDYDEPFHALTTAELFAGYVTGEITVTLKGGETAGEEGGTSSDAVGGNVVHLGRKPS